ncbi:YopX family protein [Streptococcus mitis]|jgi:hypothetical protein|uniref:YopX family protein n=1 Tax=Streptococcus mitis TaxID=28037 RepID=UPI001CBB629E|nr:YopX family protein [Streptococcus mitis]MBZ2106937.1 YopX family protein [Streptococcus mitis]MBZ2114733.1 YopX family protein [Streptococcus mitis]DAN39757.1 MAG TPA: YopX protein [Caudoviricetes sp.]
MIPKFRGRSVEAFSEEEWKYGYLIEDEGYSFIINQVIEANEQYITIGSWCPVNPDTLGQSTGLRDYFGKELFEGDVIEWSYWDEFEDSGTAKIIFDKGMFKLLDVCTEKSVWDNLFDCIENCSVFLQGNIYENPELLEDK